MAVAAFATVLFAFLMVVSTPATAGSLLYRCVGSDGGMTYGSSRVSGQTCNEIHYPGGGRSRHSSPAVWSPSGHVSSRAMPAGLPLSAVLSTSPPTVSLLAATNDPAVSARGIGSPATSIGSIKPNGHPSVRRQHGQIYSFVQDGITHYESFAPHGIAHVEKLRTIKWDYIETCFACGVRAGVNFATLALNTQAFANEIATASRSYGVDESLVRAIIHAESAFNPNALSYKGAQGLMQLMPGTARRFGVGNTFSAVDNISGGVQYLSFLSKRFNGDVRLIAAAYNAGEGAVDRYRGVPPYAETQRYVERVGTLAERYRSSAK